MENQTSTASVHASDHQVEQEKPTSSRSNVKVQNKRSATYKSKNARKNFNTANMTDDEKNTAELYKKVQGVLNKLAPSKFDALLRQLYELNINNNERLQGVVDLIYEKAVDQLNSSAGIARLCRELALMQVPADKKDKNDVQEFVNFRKLLIMKCQQEFEKKSLNDTERSRKVLELEDCPDQEKKKDLQIDLDEYDRRLRMKSVGNIRFIGELFKQQMLTTNIMLRCLNNLLETRDEESLECLCKLLTTVGKELEIAKNVDLSSIFNTMKAIVDKKEKISSRVRFLLQDVIDLRLSKWVPQRLIIPGRRNVNNDDNWPTALSQNSRVLFLFQSDKLKSKLVVLSEDMSKTNRLRLKHSNVKETSEEHYDKLKELEKDLDKQIQELEKQGANTDLKQEMEALHLYNDIKDAAQTVLGYLADVELKTIVELHKEFNLPLD